MELIFITLFLTNPAFAEETILFVPYRVKYAENVNIPPAIRKCNPGRKISAVIEKKAPKKYTLVRKQPVLGHYKMLEMEIVEILNNGFVVKGVLYDQDRKRLGSFTAFRGSMRFGACPVAESAARKIGRDIAKWLKFPTKGAILGH